MSDYKLGRCRSPCTAGHTHTHTGRDREKRVYANWATKVIKLSFQPSRDLTDNVHSASLDTLRVRYAVYALQPTCVAEKYANYEIIQGLSVAVCDGTRDPARPCPARNHTWKIPYRYVAQPTRVTAHRPTWLSEFFCNSTITGVVIFNP